MSTPKYFTILDKLNKSMCLISKIRLVCLKIQESDKSEYSHYYYIQKLKFNKNLQSSNNAMLGRSNEVEMLRQQQMKANLNQIPGDSRGLEENKIGESEESNPSHALRELSIQLKCMQREIQDLHHVQKKNEGHHLQVGKQKSKKESNLEVIDNELSKDDSFIHEVPHDMKIKFPK